MTNRYVSVLLVLLAISSTAVAVQPPPPRPIGIGDVIPAAYHQGTPDVAWDGSQFIAVWRDQRKMWNWRYADVNSVFAARIDKEGRVLERYGNEISGSGSLPRVASNGNGSLAGYTDGFSGFVVPLGSNARPSGATVNVGQGQILDLASNGSTYCAILSSPQGGRAIILDSNGAVLQTFAIAGSATAVASIGRTYYVISSRGQDVLATMILSSGARAAKHIASSRTPETVPVVIAGDDHLLVAWHAVSQEITAHEYVVVDENLEAVAPQLAIPGGSPYGNGYDDTPSLAWDGRVFVLSWSVYDAFQQAVRIEHDGELLDEEPVPLEGRIVRFGSAHSGDVTLLVSEEGPGYTTDLYARSLASLHGIRDLGPGKLVTFSATPQMQPDVAYSSEVNTALAVSVDGQGPDSIVTTLFDPERLASRQRRLASAQTVSSQKEGPSVGVAGTTFLVAWREMSNFRTRIAARRIAADGTFLGEQVPIADENNFLYFGKTAIASDGDVFLIVWDSPNGEIHGRRVRANGEFLDSQPFAISRHPAAEARERGNPAVVWTGSEFLVAWSEHEVYYSAPPAGRTTIRGARVTVDGTVIDSGESKTFFSDRGHGTGVDVAAGAGGMMLVASFSSWIDLDIHNIVALPLDLTGNATASEPTRLDVTPARAQLGPATVAAVGDTFYALWTEDQGATSRVRGTQLSDRAEIIDRFDNGGDPAYSPAATTAGDEVLIVQSQEDTRQAKVFRLFTNSFVPGENATTRGRTVRH